ncbi:KWG repeat-containing protein [Neobacillus bataviensis LMG 21833]|uniref:KWG repeat-containing protein n=1 Tax=Neobacillus bataviensis LMG 21833 TaxID=1117379 RepID=K6DPA3_9BACI|nr:WG repeat-containing protein [Neobacillus bataviensis]EKN69988.1 KWG repeat-containing protein [Neobacillus bataviensis LMG 21833]
MVEHDGDWIYWILDAFETRAVYLFPAPVKEIGGTKWGYIDAKGEFVLEPIYEDAKDFQDNGLAVVGMMDKSGLIDDNGYFIVKPKYDTIQPFSEGRAVVNDSQGFKVIDESGKEITEKAYSVAFPEYKERRLLVEETDVNGQYLYGFLNKSGKVVIPIIYQSASDFSEGKAVVKRKNGSFELIDLTGNVLQTYSLAFVDYYGQGLLVYKKSEDGKFGYVDEQGKTVIEPQFSSAESFIDDRAIVGLTVKNNNRFGVIDRKGNFVLKPNYTSIMNLGENRFAIGKELAPEQPCLRSIYALADSEGRILTGFIFKDINTFYDGLASVSDDQYTFYIDKNGKRMEHLPMVSGNGWLSFEKTLIKGDVDNRLVYFNRNGEEVWKQAAIIPLNNHYSVVEHKYRPNMEYLVYYPQVHGMENPDMVNKTLKELAGVKPVPAGKQLESNYTGDFEINFYKKNLLVIEINGYDYMFCAAHGMPVKKYVHINLRNGSMYQLKDLFKSGSPYVKVLSAIILDQIKSNEQYSYLFPDEYHGIKADQPFFISEGALNIYFKPYEIAAFVAGFPTFTLPFDELKDIINQSGEFWKSFH